MQQPDLLWAVREYFRPFESWNLRVPLVLFYSTYCGLMYAGHLLFGWF